MSTQARARCGSFAPTPSRAAIVAQLSPYSAPKILAADPAAGAQILRRLVTAAAAQMLGADTTAAQGSPGQAAAGRQVSVKTALGWR